METSLFAVEVRSKKNLFAFTGYAKRTKLLTVPLHVSDLIQKSIRFFGYFIFICMY